MSEYCTDCKQVYDQEVIHYEVAYWSIRIDLCPKHAKVDEAIDYLRLAVSLIEQMLKGEGNRLDHETVYGAIARHYAALAKAEVENE